MTKTRQHLGMALKGTSCSVPIPGLANSEEKWMWDDRATHAQGLPFHHAASFVMSLAFLLVSLNLCGQEAGFGPAISVLRDLPDAKPRPLPTKNRIDQTPEEAMRNSRGCIECHKGIDTLSMHASTNGVLCCTACHGGSANPPLTQRKTPVTPRNPLFLQSSAKPSEAHVFLNPESAPFI